MKKRKSVETDENVRVSKSAKKRNSTALQKIGEEFCAIPSQYRQKMDLPQDLREALCEHDNITNREAGRRQRQYIGRLMREIEPRELIDAIANCMDKGDLPHILGMKLLTELRNLESNNPE